MTTGLKRRLVPKLLIARRSVGLQNRPLLITSRRYEDRIDVGDPVSQAKIYEAQLADELLVLNIDRMPIEGDSMMLELIERLASETFMPLAVGGGVVSVEDFALLLEAGADKVCVNTAALERPDLITAAAARFGAQCVVVSVDVRCDPHGEPRVYADRARTPTGRHALDWAREAVSRGAGELLITDVDRDGMGTGLNLDLGRAIAEAVPVPVILSGGCGLAEHIVDGFRRASAEAVAAGTFFCFRDQNPMQTRAHIKNAAIPIRMGT